MDSSTLWDGASNCASVPAPARLSGSERAPFKMFITFGYASVLFNEANGSFGLAVALSIRVR